MKLLLVLLLTMFITACTIPVLETDCIFDIAEDNYQTVLCDKNA